MEEVTWIEVLSRKRDVVSRQRAAASTVTIGRAYDNDIVFDDPHMAGHHMRLARDDDGTWFAEDLGSINGIHVEGVRHQRVVLDDDSILQVGQTSLRVRTSTFVVAAEVPVARVPSRWPAALISLAALFALVFLQNWLGKTGEPKLIDYLGPVLLSAIVAAVWASAWSGLSRIFTGHARYSLHLLIIGMGLLLFTLYMQLSEMAAFALSWTALATHTYVIGWLAGAAICFMHLRAIDRVKLPLKAVSVVVLAVLGMTMQGLQQSGHRASTGQAVALQRLEPPALRIVHAPSEAAFFASAAQLKTTLDKARVGASMGGAGGSGE